MAAWSSGLQQSALLMLFFTLMSVFTHAAPLSEQSTEMGYPTSYSNGCYYNFQHYDEGDRILTNEPCLNCTCHNEMLMCYLRVCPFTKAIGQDCKVEKRPDQCCPTITCPEVPVKLVPSTTPSTAVGHMNEYGCFIDSLFYTDGARVPSNPNKPCELCYCIRNRTACVMQECTLKIEGCKPVYQEGVCCPAKYDCEYPEQNLLDTTTTTERTTPSIITTTMLPGSQVCVFNNEIYADGALINKDVPCQYCYCMKGDIVCAVQECNPTPLEKINCTAFPPKEGQCCPENYDCDNIIEEELTTLIYDSTTLRIDDVDNEVYATKPQFTTEKPTYVPAGHVPKLDESEVLPEVTKQPETTEYVHTTEEKVPLTKLPEIVTEDYITSEKMTESHAQVTEHPQPLTTVKEEQVFTSEKAVDEHEQKTELTPTDLPSRFGEEEISSTPKPILTTGKPTVEEHTQKQPEELITSIPIETTAIPSKPIDITSVPEKVESATTLKEEKSKDHTTLKASEEESTKIPEHEVKYTTVSPTERVSEEEPSHTTVMPSDKEFTTVIEEEIITSKKESTTIAKEESKHTTKSPIEKDSTVAEEPKHTTVSTAEKDFTKLPIEEDLTTDKEPKHTTVSPSKTDSTSLSKEVPKQTTVSSTEKDLLAVTEEEPKHTTVSSSKEEFTTVSKEESKPSTVEEASEHSTELPSEKYSTTVHELKHTTVSPSEKDLTTIYEEQKHTTISPSEKNLTTILEEVQKQSTSSTTEKDSTTISEEEPKHTTVTLPEKELTTFTEEQPKHVTAIPIEKEFTTVAKEEVTTSKKVPSTTVKAESQHTTVSPSEKESTTYDKEIVTLSGEESTTVAVDEPKHTTIRSDEEVTRNVDVEPKQTTISPIEKETTVAFIEESKPTEQQSNAPEEFTISVKDEHVTLPTAEKAVTEIVKGEDTTKPSVEEPKHTTVFEEELTKTPVEDKIQPASIVPIEEGVTKVPEKEELEEPKHHTTSLPTEELTKVTEDEVKHTTLTTVIEDESKHTTEPSLTEDKTRIPEHTTGAPVASEETKSTIQKDDKPFDITKEHKPTTISFDVEKVTTETSKHTTIAPDAQEVSELDKKEESSTNVSLNKEEPTTVFVTPVSEETTHVSIMEPDKKEESSAGASPHKEELTTVFDSPVSEETTHVAIVEPDRKEESASVSPHEEKHTTVFISPMSEETTHVSVEKNKEEELEYTTSIIPGKDILTKAPIEEKEKQTTVSPSKEESTDEIQHITVSEDNLTKSPEEQQAVSEGIIRPEHIDDKEITKSPEQTTVKHVLETKTEESKKPEEITEASKEKEPEVMQAVTEKEETTVESGKPLHIPEKELTTPHTLLMQPEDEKTTHVDDKHTTLFEDGAVTTEVSSDTPELGDRLDESTDGGVVGTSEHTTISIKSESVTTTAMEEHTTIVSVTEISTKSDKVTTHKPVVTTLRKEDEEEISKTTESEPETTKGVDEELPERDDHSAEEDFEEHTTSSEASVTELHLTSAYTEITVVDVSTKKDIEIHGTEATSAEPEVTSVPKEDTTQTLEADTDDKIKETHVTKAADDELTTVSSSSKPTTVEELTKVSEEATHPTVKKPQVTTIFQIEEEKLTTLKIIKADITTTAPIKQDEENDIEYSTSAEPVYTVTPERLPSTGEQTTTSGFVITEEHKPAEEHSTEVYAHVTEEPVVTVTAVAVDTETPTVPEEEKDITEQPGPIEKQTTTAVPEISVEQHTTRESISTVKPEITEKVSPHDILPPAKEPVTTAKSVTTEKPKHSATTQIPTEATKLPEEGKETTITPTETTSVKSEVTEASKEHITKTPIEKEPSENEISTEDYTKPIHVATETVVEQITEKHITEPQILVEVKPVEESITKVPPVSVTKSEDVTDKVYAGTELPSIISSTDGQVINETRPISESTTQKELIFTVKPVAVTEEETEIPSTVTPDEEYIPPQVLEEATRETTDTEKATTAPEKTTTEHVVPGEGSCLVDGQTYANNTNVPPINHCQISCVCISSILQCTSVTCSPAPSNLHNCMPLYHGPDSCCPTYSCTVPEPTEIESDSHKMEDTTVKEQPVTVAIQVLPAESEKPEITTQSDEYSTEAAVSKVSEHTTSVAEIETQAPITKEIEIHTTEGKLTSKPDQEEIVTVIPSKPVSDGKIDVPITEAPKEYVTLEDRFEGTTVSEEKVTKQVEIVSQSTTYAPKPEEPIHVPVIIEKLPEEEKSHTTAEYEPTTLISTEKPEETTHRKEDDTTISQKVVETTEFIKTTTAIKEEPIKSTTPYEIIEHVTTVEDKKSESTEESAKSTETDTEPVTVPEKESEITESFTKKPIPEVSSTSVHLEEQPKVTTQKLGIIEAESDITTPKPIEHVTEGLKEEETKYPYSKPFESVTESVESHTEKKESEITTSHGPLITTLHPEITTIKDKKVPTESQKSTEPSVTESDKTEEGATTSASKEPEATKEEHTTTYPEIATTPVKEHALEAITSKVSEIEKEHTTVPQATEGKISEGTTEQEVRIPTSTIPSFTDRIDIEGEESDKGSDVTTEGRAAEPEITTYYAPRVSEVTTHAPIDEKESEKPEIGVTEKEVESAKTTQKLPEVTTISHEIFSSSQEPFSSTSLSSLLTEAVLNHTELYTTTPQYPTITESTSMHSDFSEHTPEVPDYHVPPEDEYEEEDHGTFGPGTCRYGGKMYVSAQQIPRDDPCDFCFCFRSDIICLQQSCPPPIPRCHEEPIRGFCCPRYECPVSMATAVNITTTTTTTTTTLPPIFFSHAYKGRATRQGCQIQGRDYQIGEEIRSSSGPCLQCKCGGDGQMKCDPKPCSPEPMIRKMIAEATARRRR